MSAAAAKSGAPAILIGFGKPMGGKPSGKSASMKSDPMDDEDTPDDDMGGDVEQIAGEALIKAIKSGDGQDVYDCVMRIMKQSKPAPKAKPKAGADEMDDSED